MASPADHFPSGLSARFCRTQTARLYNYEKISVCGFPCFHSLPKRNEPLSRSPSVSYQESHDTFVSTISRNPPPDTPLLPSQSAFFFSFSIGFPSILTLAAQPDFTSHFWPSYFAQQTLPNPTSSSFIFFVLVTPLSLPFSPPAVYRPPFNSLLTLFHSPYTKQRKTCSPTTSRPSRHTSRVLHLVPVLAKQFSSISLVHFAYNYILKPQAQT